MEPAPTPSPTERFRALDGYRVSREWARYEGTAQRELFLELRLRFLRRHRLGPGPTVDLGSGPGRFSDALGGADAPKVLVDLSKVALQQARDRPSDGRRVAPPRHYVVGDAASAPLDRGVFGTVALLGNVLGFSEDRWERVLESAALLTATRGTLLIEAVAGHGEHARYLQRLPRRAAARSLRAPPRWLDARIEREGFQPMDPRKPDHEAAFQRIPAELLGERLARWGFRTVEVSAVAPTMGTDPERIETARMDPKAWAGLLALEERWGAQPSRWTRAAAFLLAAERTPPGSPELPKPSIVRASARPSAHLAVVPRNRRPGRAGPLGRRRAPP
ncbi:MAG: class I SAM-dependent methyltransferase [Thermoplasmata archaeon]|nr:class I SAM-dependent methyltransferase [Thermoplasmata archaeon]